MVKVTLTNLMLSTTVYMLAFSIPSKFLGNTTIEQIMSMPKRLNVNNLWYDFILENGYGAYKMLLLLKWGLNSARGIIS